MLNFLNTPSFGIMQKNLDILAQRINITGQNITNAETPHYKAKKLEYENLFQEKLAALNNSYTMQLKYSGEKNKEKLREYLGSVEPTVFTDDRTETRTDGNNVDIDYENLELARTQLQYNFMVRKITDEYNLLRHAISEGRQ
ncbi:MAG: flagellar basal body rod protein FlgB [Oscillospiraceae bacterium]|nr:flagellar basal body rod protein FlgB [Oscillospiraceae bacterium]